MNNVSLIEEFNRLIEARYGNLASFSEDEQENNRKRSEAFLECYECLINIFERDIEPVIQGQLVERKNVTLQLNKN